MKKTLLALAVASAATQAIAESNKLETVLVTATRTTQTIDTTLAPVSVFDREDIARLQASDLADLLDRTPGISLIRNGGAGSRVSVSIRGNAADHALVLVDGQRITSATSGETSFQFIDPSQIERIEVVRGPRSSLYGSDAVGGVIQIFTKAEKQDKELRLSSSIGNNETRAYTAGFAASSDALWGNINISHFDTAGIDSTTDKTGTKADDDGYRNTTGSLSLGGKVANNEISFDYYYADTFNEFDDSAGTSNPSSEGITNTANLRVVTQASDNWVSTVKLGHSENKSSTFGSSPSTFDTLRDSASWQNDVRFADNQLISVGFDYYVDKVESSETFTDSQQENSGLFVQYQGAIGPVDVAAGLRRSDNQSFGQNDTGNISLGVDADDSLRFVLSYGTAFKAPTFNDLFFPAVAYSCPGPFCYMYSGNPDLAPEESANYEFEVRRELDNGGVAINVFDSEIENLIQLQSSFGPSGISATVANVESASIRGAELSVWKIVGNWTLDASLTQQKPVDDADGNILRRRPRQIASFNADTQFGDVKFGISVNGQGASYDDSANTKRLDGYATVDLRFAVDLSEELALQLKLGNIFNKEYSTSLDFGGNPYASEGSSSLLTLSYTPQLD